MSNTEKIKLVSKTGFTVEVLNLGGIITKIMALDKYGNRENVVLNYENLDDYLTNPLYLGCFVGPVAGRTKNGELPIDDEILQLDVSCHSNSLHSCNDGLHNVIWHVDSQTADCLVLSYTTKNNHGVIDYKVTYTVFEETLTINYYANTHMKTYLTLTNHSYFNLSGNPEKQSKHIISNSIAHILSDLIMKVFQLNLLN
ncbi:aldose epimerase family protein [Fusibacter bizertensis]